jgi:hypothetical protein
MALPSALGDPTGVSTYDYYQHMLYRGEDGLLHYLWWGPLIT